MEATCFIEKTGAIKGWYKVEVGMTLVGTSNKNIINC